MTAADARTDEQLMAAAAQGQRPALAALYDKYWKHVWLFFIRNYALERHAAMDLAQDVFTDLWKMAGRFDGSSKFTSYLFGIARNKALYYLRERRRDSPRHGTEQAMEMSTETQPERGIHNQELMMQIEDTMRQLPEEWRTALFLREYHQFDYREIAATMGAPLSSVETWIHRGRRRFIELFSRQHKEFANELL